MSRDKKDGHTMAMITFVKASTPDFQGELRVGVALTTDALPLKWEFFELVTHTSHRLQGN